MAKVIGITGGIASGKSTVTAFLREQGYPVIDADAVVHELQAKGGKLYQVLVDWLGDNILQVDGQLNRQLLSTLIFGNPDNLAKSAELQNPIIRQELARLRHHALTEYPLIFMDIPLLFEQEYASWCDQVWLVYVDKQTQVKRLMARNHLSQEDAELRISRQMPLNHKRLLADKIIDNSGAPAETLRQVSQYIKTL